MIYDVIQRNRHVLRQLLHFTSSICGGFTEKQKEVISNFVKLYFNEPNFDYISKNFDEDTNVDKEDIIVLLNSIEDEQTIFILLFQAFLVFSCDGLSEYKKTRLLDIISYINISIESTYLLLDIFINHKTKAHQNILTIGSSLDNDIIMKRYNSRGFFLRVNSQYYACFQDLSIGNVNNIVKINDSLAYDWVIYPIDKNSTIELDGKNLTLELIKARLQLKNSQEILTYNVVEEFDKDQNKNFKILYNCDSENTVGQIMIFSGCVSIKNLTTPPILSINETVSTTELSTCNLDDVIYVDKLYKLDLFSNIQNISNNRELTIKKVEYEIIKIGTDAKDNIVFDDFDKPISLLLEKQEGIYGRHVWTLSTVIGNKELLLNGRSLQEKVTIKNGDILSIGVHHIIFDVDNNLISHSKNVITSIAFKNLCYSHKNSRSEMALNNLTFSNKIGDFCCIMGPSGAGKSTLVKVIANLYKVDRDDMISCNGLSLNKNFNIFKEYFSYVSQEDVLFDNLTVYENLFHYGKLKNPKISNDELNKKIDEILIRINLISKKGQIVGTPDRRILSGGERRRLNIALELISDTDIMILDEPTSGLSSYDSEKIISMLQDLAKTGKIIYVVIHQPSREIFLKFSHFLLLDRGGYLAYFGPTKDAFFYFSKYSVNHYPATPDDLLSILEEVRKTPDGKIIYEKNTKHPKPIRVHSSQQWSAIFNEYRKGVEKKKSDQKVKNMTLPAKKKLDFKDRCVQFSHLLQRNLVNKFHGQRFLLISILTPMFLSLVALFLRDFKPDYSFATNTQIPKFLFLTAIILIFLAVSNSINEILNEKYVIRKESLIGYSVFSYYLNKLISQTIICLYQDAIYVICSFLILQVPIISHFSFLLQFYLMSLIASISVCSLALMISVFIHTEKQAFMVIPIFIIPQIVFGGMFINFNDINFKINQARPVAEICDFMHARWMFESYVALMQTEKIDNKGVNDFTIDYNIIEKKGKSKDKSLTAGSVVYARRLELMQDSRVAKQYFKKHSRSIKKNLNIFPSTVKLFYSSVVPTYIYNILIMFLFIIFSSIVTCVMLYREK